MAVCNGNVEIVNNVIMVGEVTDSTSSAGDFRWKTTLELQPGKSFIESEELVLTDGQNTSVWRVNLMPNYVDETRTHYLSIFLTLVNTSNSTNGQEMISASFNAKLLIDSLDDGAQNEFDHKHSYSFFSALQQYSKDHPSYGTKKFIPMYKLGPVAQPNSKEMLMLAIEISALFNASKADKRNVQITILENETPETLADRSFQKKFFEVPLKHDASVRFLQEYILVDSARIKHFTSFFDKYFIYHHSEMRVIKDYNIPNLSNIKELRGSVKLTCRIIDYCHDGDLRPHPQKVAGVIHILNAAIFLEITPLRDLCQQLLIRSPMLSVKSFVEIVELVKKRHLKEIKALAYKNLYQFMVENMVALKEEKRFKDTWIENEEFYAKLMRYNHSGDNESDSEGEEKPAVEVED